MRKDLNHPQRQKKESEKPTGRATVAVYEEVPTKRGIQEPGIQENEQPLERLLSRYLRIYRVVGTHSPS